MPVGLRGEEGVLSWGKQPVSDIHILRLWPQGTPPPTFQMRGERPREGNWVALSHTAGAVG